MLRFRPSVITPPYPHLLPTYLPAVQVGSGSMNPATQVGQYIAVNLNPAWVQRQMSKGSRMMTLAVTLSGHSSGSSYFRSSLSTAPPFLMMSATCSGGGGGGGGAAKSPPMGGGSAAKSPPMGGGNMGGMPMGGMPMGRKLLAQ